MSDDIDLDRLRRRLVNQVEWLLTGDHGNETEAETRRDLFETVRDIRRGEAIQDGANVVVNGARHRVDNQASFEQIVALAVGPGDVHTPAYTVVFQRGWPSRTDGSLAPGETVPARDGMIFTVAKTGSA